MRFEVSLLTNTKFQHFYVLLGVDSLVHRQKLVLRSPLLFISGFGPFIMSLNAECATRENYVTLFFSAGASDASFV